MISDLLNSEIIALFTNVAKTHTAILHLATPKLIRFCPFNPEQLDADNRSSFNWDKMVLSLTLPGQPGISWTYKDSGTSTLKEKMFDVAILGTPEGDNDFAADETICDAAEQVCDDIQTWMYKTANSSANKLWPVLDLINFDRVYCRRLYNVGIAGCSGAALRFTLHANLQYKSSNPLNNMTP